MSTLLQFLSDYGPPGMVLIQLVTCGLLCRIVFNDLPHIRRDLRGLSERISSLEGLKEGIQLERMNK